MTSHAHRASSKGNSLRSFTVVFAVNTGVCPPVRSFFVGFIFLIWSVPRLCFLRSMIFVAHHLCVLSFVRSMILLACSRRVTPRTRVREAIQSFRRKSSACLSQRVRQHAALLGRHLHGYYCALRLQAPPLQHRPFSGLIVLRQELRFRAFCP